MEPVGSAFYRRFSSGLSKVMSQLCSVGHIDMGFLLADILECKIYQKIFLVIIIEIILVFHMC